MTIDEAFCILRSLPDDWGTSGAEVQQVETRLGVRLPPPLRDLMLSTGRRMHWLFPDEEIAPLAALPDLHEVAREILSGDAPSLRPPFRFVTISQNQGYEFSFVRANGVVADPEMLHYVEGHCFQRRGLSIGQFIAGALRRVLSRA